MHTSVLTATVRAVSTEAPQHQLLQFQNHQHADPDRHDYQTRGQGQRGGGEEGLHEWGVGEQQLQHEDGRHGCQHAWRALHTLQRE